MCVVVHTRTHTQRRRHGASARQHLCERTLWIAGPHLTPFGLAMQNNDSGECDFFSFNIEGVQMQLACTYVANISAPSAYIAHRLLERTYSRLHAVFELVRCQLVHVRVRVLYTADPHARLLRVHNNTFLRRHTEPPPPLPPQHVHVHPQWAHDLRRPAFSSCSSPRKGQQRNRPSTASSKAETH